MIKIKDLMLDDIVLTKDGHIAKVVSLYKNHKGSGGDIMVDSDSKTFMSLVREDDLKPIPLTEEILLKIGFKVTGSFIELVEYVLNDADIEVCVFYNRESNLTFLHNRKSVEPYFYVEIANVEVKIEYVHQLQHLLRQCKLDDLADNLKVSQLRK